MPNNQLRVVAHITSKPDTVQQTKELLTGLIEPTRAEDGCVTYELLQNNNDPTDFTFVEEWADDAALDAHLNSPHLGSALPLLADLLAAPPDIRRYSLIA